jgi:hypothetical protein
VCEDFSLNTILRNALDSFLPERQGQQWLCLCLIIISICCVCAGLFHDCRFLPFLIAGSDKKAWWHADFVIFIEFPLWICNYGIIIITWQHKKATAMSGFPRRHTRPARLYFPSTKGVLVSWPDNIPSFWRPERDFAWAFIREPIDCPGWKGKGKRR